MYMSKDVINNLLPPRASEQGKVIGVCLYVGDQKKI